MDHATARTPIGFTRYLVTPDGQVVVRSTGRVLATCVHRTGYKTVEVWNDERGKRCRTSLHRLVLLAFEGEKPTPKHVARHLNGNRLDNRAANLKWGTNRENHADAIRHGTHSSLSPSGTFRAHVTRGEDHVRAKLTAEQVIEIDRRVTNGETSAAIAADYDIAPATVRAIRARKSWRHLWADAS